MSVLYGVLCGDIYASYVESSRGQMNFAQFLEFCKNYSIFPAQSSKATLNTIFNSQATPTPAHQANQTTTRNLSLSCLAENSHVQNNASTTFQVIGKREFIQCVTLSALVNQPEVQFKRLLNRFARDGFVSTELERLASSKCLAQVTLMNSSEGTAQVLKNQSVKFDVKPRVKDLLLPFAQYENYAWWFRERQTVKQRFAEKKAKPKFEDILMESTAH